MSNKFSLWTAALLAGLSNIAHAQSIPEPKSSLVPIGKAQPAAITPTKPAPSAPAASAPPLVVLTGTTKPVAAVPKLATQAKLATAPTKVAPQAIVVTVPAKVATVAKVVTIPAKVVTVPAKATIVAAPAAPVAAPLAPKVQARPQAMPLSAAGAVAGRSGAATISEIAANQANALAKAAAIKTTPPAITPAMPAMSSTQIVPELFGGQVIPNLMTSSSKARTPPPPRPYISAIIGLKGQEIVEIQPGDGVGYTLRAGDSIQNWMITRIADGRVHMSTTEHNKKKRTSESKNKIVAVGDFL